MIKYGKAIYTGAAALLITLVCFTATAFAAGAVAAAGGEASVLDLARPVIDAITSGEYVYASALALVLVVAALRKYGSKRWPWLNGEVGAPLLVLLGSFFGAIGAVLGRSESLTLETFKVAAMVAITAAGGYALINKLIIKPLMKPLLAKAPAWLKPLLKIVVWAFDRPTRVAAAEKAGTDAVKANPSKGAADVVGTIDDIA